ncbi:MAG: efflux RND transporter periplasmic adaptor subunit, partial [Bacteroidota bacterium]
LDNFSVDADLVAFPEPVNEQEKFFVASRNLYAQYYTIKSAENRLDKYVLTAPFSGVLTSVNINNGALVRAGQSLGELMNTGSYELEATIPLSELEYLQVGNRVQLRSEDINGEWTGKVKRISNQIDPSTQSVRVFIEVSGKNLREGMYLTGLANASTIKDAFALPRNLIVNQNQVYQVQDTLLRLREVEVVKITAESAIVKGLPEGMQLLKEPIPGAFDGMPVKVSRSEQLGTIQ